MLVDKTTAYRAPSTALQRIILCVLFTAIGAAVWWQQPDERDSYRVKKVEPATLADDVVNIDFGAAEASWSDVTINEQGMLEIDAKAELALSEVVALMSGEATDLQMERMTFLIEKQFGSAVSEQFAGVLPAFKKYKDTEQRWWEENGSSMSPAYADLFQLQDEILGETIATKLFSEQRRMANLMLAGYYIQNDAGLTEAEREQALAELHGSFHVGGTDE